MLITERRADFRQEFAQRMQQRHQEEARLEQAIFGGRLKELEQQKQPKYLEALERQIEQQRKRLLQPVLFAEIQQEQEQQRQYLRELEWDLAHSHLERMKQLVVNEQTRIIEKVLPKRYTLATVDVQPLAIEYIVRSTGKEHVSCQ
jgi:uncharacterized membrane protein YheB (UPF0754 family)